MEDIIKWSNDNSGFLSLILFIIALLFGWVSGIFRTLRSRPKLKIRLVDGPTMISTFKTGRKSNGIETHSTAISLYLDVTNIGSASTDIQKTEIAYHNHSFKFTYLWFWLKNETIILSDFMFPIGDNVKVFPFFNQASSITGKNTDRFLEIGKRVNGVAYFEQRESWGGFKPRINNQKVKIKIRIRDSFGGTHTRIEKIPVVSLNEAQKYNDHFGQTLETLRKDTEPVE